MRARIRIAGHDGVRFEKNEDGTLRLDHKRNPIAVHYQIGEVCEQDSEWLRKFLVNGLAEPLDGDARTVCADPAQIEKYYDYDLIGYAQALGVLPKHIPAVREFGDDVQMARESHYSAVEWQRKLTGG